MPAVEARPISGPALTRQKAINAYNFPFTLNPTINCLYGCRYCYLAGALVNHLPTGNPGRRMASARQC
jgi:DNA repair photolyase